MVHREALLRPASYRDRGAALVAFGVFLVALGAIGLTAAIALFLFPMSAPGDRAGDQQPVLTTIVAAALPVTVVLVGIGAILARRWARTLALVLSWRGL